MPLNKIIVSLVMLLFVTSGEVKSQLNGVKTIGNDIDDHYPTIKDAVVDLNSKGINAPVVFEIDSGAYDGGFTINSISGATVNDTILFISATGDYNDVIIQNQTDSNNDYFVKLNGCERVTFKTVTFKTVSSSYSNQITLTGGASYNRFENCIFDSKIELDCHVLENDRDGIVIYNQPSDTKEEFNQFINNKITGGCIGISLEGETHKLEEGNQIIGNEFAEQNYKAVDIVHNLKGLFNDNIVRYKGDFTAVTLNVDTVYEVQGNRIYSEGETALFIDTFNAYIAKPIGFKGLSVFNNAISCPNGIALKGNKIDGFFLGHNTLFNDTEQYTIDIDSVVNMLSVFNLLVNKADYGVFNITTSATPKANIADREFGSNFNGVFSGDSTIGRFNGNEYKTIENWRLNNHDPDPNSSFGNIEFNDDTLGLQLICGTSPSMRVKRENLDSEGKSMIDLLSGAFVNLFKTKDINGNERDTSKFWKGQAEISIKITINGYIADSLGIDTLKAGKVIIFAKRHNKNILEEIGKMDVSHSGFYTIDSLPYRDNYWLKIIPDKEKNPEYVPSYHTKELRWDAETGGPRPLSDFCDETIIYNMFPRKLDTLVSGDYTLSGNVSQTQSDGTNKMDARDPIPGLDVILDQIPPSRTVAITETDEYGNYSFPNLPEGTFIVTIDYQGLPKDTLYKIILDGERDSIVDLNYCVDTTKQIEGCPNPLLGMENPLFEDVLLYPNPMGETLTISGVDRKFDLSILDARGREIMNLSNQSDDAFISTGNFQSGIYFVCIKTFDGNSMHKIIK